MRHQILFHYLDKVARVGSIRKAAEELSITPSALNRRILAVEKELGEEIFERHAAGVRLNTAGEIFLQHVRHQMSDLERVKSQIADLSGMRRGHINVSCTQEIVRYFMPRQIHKYQTEYPAVTFNISQHVRGDAELSLLDHTSDIALVFEPLRLAGFQTVLSVRQQVYCIMSIGHPLAQKRSLRLYECLEYALLLPEKTEGVRRVLDVAAAKTGLTLKPIVESNSLGLLQRMSLESSAISFTIAVNLEPLLETSGLTAVPIDERDVTGGFLFAGHLRGRTLPVAAARFLENISKELGERYG